MKLFHKIAWRFAVIILIIIVTGFSIYHSINSLASASGLIEHEALGSTQSISDIRYLTSSVRRLEIMTTIADTEEQKKLVERQEKTKLDTKKAVEELLRHVRGGSSDNDSVADKETEVYKKLLQTMQSTIDIYFADNLKTNAAILAKDESSWKISIFGEGRKNYNNMMAAIDAVIESNKLFATYHGKVVDNMYDRATLVTFSCIVISIIVSMFLAWQLTHVIVDPLKKTAIVAERVARGDLTTKIKTDRKDEIGQLLVAVSHMQNSLVNLVNHVKSGSESVATASIEIAQGNMDLSARTESQASALEETAASMEELSSAVSKNAHTANKASELANIASALAVKGGASVDQVVVTIKEIDISSKKISDIISVIDGIAFQTNILALNAAVEAARAGEQGKGFAVVATEVRSLAGRSAEAAKEIKALIDTSVMQVTEGVKLADSAGNQMSEVVGAINKVTDLVKEISNASREQSAGVAEVGEAVNQMDHVTQQNAALVEEMAAAAGGLKIQAEKLVAEVSVFKIL